MAAAWTAADARLVLAAALAGAAPHAAASWRCADAFGNSYVVGQPFGERGLSCAELTEPVHAEAAILELPVPMQEPPAAPLVRPDPFRRGSLVLEPPLRVGPLRVAAWPMASPRSNEFDPLIEAVARDTGEEANLLRAIVQVESRFEPAAVSAKGAIGLMQVMPATAAQFGLAEPERTLFQPESNLRIGALYLRRLSMLFSGKLELVIAAYNAGEGAVVRSGFAIPPYPETQGYVSNVLAIYRQLRATR